MPVIDELALVSILLAAIAMVSCLSVQDRQHIRTLSRTAWTLVIILVPVAGSAAWFIAGRPRRLRIPRSTGRLLPGSAAQPRSLAPDDDAEFLQSLDHPTPERHHERTSDPKAKPQQGQDHKRRARPDQTE